MERIQNTPENIQRWAHFLKKIRQIFDSRGYFEVSTPHLVSAGAFEGAIDPLQVRWKGGGGELHTSPEIQMKEILAGARLPIYQICRCFRDDLEGPHHAREFTMLEFYRPESTYQEMMAEMAELLKNLGVIPLTIEKYSIDEIFKKNLGISLTQTNTRSKLAAEITKRNLIQFSESDTWEDLFFRLMVEHIEPGLNPAHPTFLYDYPTLVSPLSKEIPSSPFAARFEIYWKGMELCNGCTELNDPDTLRKRAEKENAQRRELGKKEHVFSETLLGATGKMGKMAGVAVGLERLFRCLF